MHATASSSSAGGGAATGAPWLRSPHNHGNSAAAHRNQQHHHMLPAMRPPPFFVREIYKNGFLKRLPHNEKRSSALSKLMRSDRFWVVFSVHDDSHPFLELWADPTEVASRPPQYVYPLAVCQHISPSIIPADSEWSFVVNFETVAIRFACNSRAAMDEWVDCVRNKLEEMGILNPKGNLYSKTPLTPTSKVVRNPMSPLPSPPPASESAADVALANVTAENNGSRNRLSIVDASDQSNQTFTTSIYLNQTPPATPPMPAVVTTTPAATAAPSSIACNRQKVASSLSLDSAYETVTLSPPLGGHKNVYLLNSSKPGPPTRHVTVIPINNQRSDSSSPQQQQQQPEEEEAEVYSAIFDDVQRPTTTSSSSQQRRRSPSRRQRPLSLAEDPQQLQQQRGRYNNHEETSRSPPKNEAKTGVSRRLSDRRQQHVNIQQRVRKKSQRSSSLGPLLDDGGSNAVGGRSANTNSLESIDSNPRQAAPKGFFVDHRARGAVPRRPMVTATNSGDPVPVAANGGQIGSPTRHMAELPHGIRPPPYHPVSLAATPATSVTSGGFPHHIPLPGLTCQLSLLHPAAQPLPTNPEQQQHQHQQRSLREQQVMRLHQEIGHPAGVRLVLRKRDCQNSLALVEFFGCLWVAGWKQRDFPVLYNAFHVGDQIVSAGGVAVRTASEFHKAVKLQQQQPQQQLHVEVLVRRLPFAQVFHLRRELDGQPLGLMQAGNTAEIREVLPGSLAAQRGMTAKVRSFDGQSLVSWVITEINGRPLSLLAKDGEAGDRLQALGRDVSVLVQPADIVQKLKKHLKSLRGYKDYVLS